MIFKDCRSLILFLLFSSLLMSPGGLALAEGVRCEDVFLGGTTGGNNAVVPFSAQTETTRALMIVASRKPLVELSLKYAEDPSKQAQDFNLATSTSKKIVEIYFPPEGALFPRSNSYMLQEALKSMATDIRVTGAEVELGYGSLQLFSESPAQYVRQLIGIYDSLDRGSQEQMVRRFTLSAISGKLSRKYGLTNQIKFLRPKYDVNVYKYFRHYDYSARYLGPDGELLKAEDEVAYGAFREYLMAIEVDLSTAEKSMSSSLGWFGSLFKKSKSSSSATSVGAYNTFIRSLRGGYGLSTTFEDSNNQSLLTFENSWDNFAISADALESRVHRLLTSDNQAELNDLVVDEVITVNSTRMINLADFSTTVNNFVLSNGQSMKEFLGSTPDDRLKKTSFETFQEVTSLVERREQLCHALLLETEVLDAESIMIDDKIKKMIGVLEQIEAGRISKPYTDLELRRFQMLKARLEEGQTTVAIQRSTFAQIKYAITQSAYTLQDFDNYIRRNRNATSIETAANGSAQLGFYIQRLESNSQLFKRIEVELKP